MGWNRRLRTAVADPDKVAPREPRKERALPDHLPRIECVIEPVSIICLCGCGDMVRIGEDRTERLDFILVARQPPWTCRGLVPLL